MSSRALACGSERGPAQMLCEHRILSEFHVQDIIQDLDAVNRTMAQVLISRLRGTASMPDLAGILRSHPLPGRQETVEYLRELLFKATDSEEALRMERILFGCIDLVLERETAELTDMIEFFVERGRMHVGTEKIRAKEVVPWVQAQRDFSKREEMRRENSIFLKVIVNPPLARILRIIVDLVTQRFGFETYVRYSEKRKQVSFESHAETFRKYIEDTDGAYRRLVDPWVEEKIGKGMENLSRYHALHLVRITRFDDHFPPSRLMEIGCKTFSRLGFDLNSKSQVIMDISDDLGRSYDGMCVGAEIPGEVHVLMRPLGGLIDVETLLHETGHAFFLSHFDPGLPSEYRRLHRSRALDETFAFLFSELIENPCWATEIAGLAPHDADVLARLFRAKRLCLIRRYIGKFLAEMEFHEQGDLADPGPYCRQMHRATGFLYEPEGYLVDMEPEFYSLDYLLAWAGAHALRRRLEREFGNDWFRNPEAGHFLKSIACRGRSNSLEETLDVHCHAVASLPDFSGD